MVLPHVSYQCNWRLIYTQSSFVEQDMYIDALQLFMKFIIEKDALIFVEVPVSFFFFLIETSAWVQVL